ncbi:hypothetical protein ASPACDRAFT_60144 [Aspergillus aculeatus ATCC 16872]|uniref:UBC core domain-containing protein n=1 Tax=Aspergillus aculeatus (strain ATCC 16872 / CBS 172.66 / WB 5094) TaxID=690307 RepID=A0A1L9WVZ3_ASPA1|nr:uncharacterized protein ASPACDRAFT_60144 [Aspergillus aculeatus ATCC 16872]OJK00303.1 hypothetical protein ASPACDRAFT_60144 [Aspergillus aculeatus ATCC 16872]
MVSASIRRLAADHAALHEELPPNYLFPPDDANADDLTQFTALLAGPQGTPYSQGLWRLHLKMPEDYPKSPPKATFKTRIWHPNVEELTGAVCVDTLKRDWKSTLTLKDVLITISCLLIYPNPDSALNAASGSLLQENYEAFARQAKLMTSIHAPVPDDLKSAVAEAKLRGEDAGTTIPVEQDEPRTLRPRKGTRITSVTMKKRTTRKTSARNTPESESSTTPQTVSAAAPTPSFSQTSLSKPSLALTTDNLTHREEDLRHQDHLQQQTHAAPNNEGNNGDEETPSDSESSTNASKENDPSLSPSPVRHRPPPTLRKNIHGKRPLSVLTLPMDMDDEDDDNQSDPDPEITPNPSASNQNIAANQTISTSPSSSPTLFYYKHPSKTHPLPTRDRESGRDHSPSSPEQPRNKSPKLSVPKRGASPMKGVNASGRIRDDVVASTPTTAAAAATVDLQIFEDPSSSPGSDDEETRRRRSGDGKENPLSKDFLPSASSSLSPGKSSHQYHPLAALGPSPITTATTTMGTMSSRRAVSASVPSSSKPLRSMTMGARKVSASAGGTGKKVKPRIGIRRL